MHIRWPSRALTDTGAEGIGHLDRGRGNGGWAGCDERQRAWEAQQQQEQLPAKHLGQAQVLTSFAPMP